MSDLLPLIGAQSLTVPVGGRASDLTPLNLMQAAQADINRAGRNHGHRGGTYEHYAFHRAHVRKANSARELVALAAAEPTMGLKSGKKWTRTIYGDAELLKQAAAIGKGL